MKNALILHGADGNHTGNWFPWLKTELEKKGYKVWAPDLPNPGHPDQEVWTDYVFSSGWEFNSESILVGHSAGATLILRILEKLPPDAKIAKAILVAGYADKGGMPNYFKYKEDMVNGGFDWDKIKESSSEFYFIHSDNDPYDCGISQGEIMHSHLGGQLLLRPGQGHFNLEQDPGYIQFPLLLELSDL